MIDWQTHDIAPVAAVAAARKACYEAELILFDNPTDGGKVEVARLRSSLNEVTRDARVEIARLHSLSTKGNCHCGRHGDDDKGRA